jgi:hypothetical protein
VIESQLHHAPEPLAMAVEELRERGLITGPQTGHKRGDFRIGFRRHTHATARRGSLILKRDGVVCEDCLPQLLERLVQDGILPPVFVIEVPPFLLVDRESLGFH